MEILEWSTLQKEVRPLLVLNVVADWRSSNTKVYVKKLFQILANNIDNWEEENGLRIFVRYFLKNEMKNKRRFGKTWYLFLA